MPDPDQLLRDAIDRNLPVTLMVSSGGLIRQMRSRFLPASETGLVIESVPEQSEALDAVIAARGRAIVTFRVDAQRIEFATQIHRRECAYPLDEHTHLDALHLEWPLHIKAIQRRADHRVNVTTDAGLRIRCWRIADQAELAEQPLPTTMLVIDVRDLSTGGFGGIWKRRRDDPLTLAIDQRLRVEIADVEGPTLFDARLRHLERIGIGDLMHVGVHFTLAGQRFSDRQKMQRLARHITELQCREQRLQKIAR